MERLEPEELDGMKRLATIGTLTHEEIDATTPLEELDLIHITDVIEMQRPFNSPLLIERLYLILGATNRAERGFSISVSLMGNA
jgi:hypothetical protein